MFNSCVVTTLSHGADPKHSQKLNQKKNAQIKNERNRKCKNLERKFCVFL